MASIELENLVMQYEVGTSAVDDVSLEIADGEFFVLVGPSGCGKSTLLRLLAGLEYPTAGTIRMAGADITGLSPRLRDAAMVFQNYAIYPHMNVRRNLGYGLRVRGMPKPAINARVEHVAQLLGLEKLLSRRPSTLSGGQLQRVAMGRAIAREPQVYLMDEPLSNLDAKLRVSMRAELERLHQRLGVTTVYVTHDQVEAMTLGQRAAVLRGGMVQQVGTPQHLYSQPANAFVAAFIGSPPMNLAVGSVRDGRLHMGGLTLDVPAGLLPPVPAGERVLVGVRPEDLCEPRFAPPDACRLQVRCVVHQDLGADILLFFAAESSPDEEEAMAAVTFSEERAATQVVAGAERLLCARVGAGFPIQDGQLVELAVAPQMLHFFDLDTGHRCSPAAETAPKG